MKKCVIMPDSFKSTMSSLEVCQIIAERVQSFYPVCETVTIPVADGGEGTIDCFVAAIAAEPVEVVVKGPCFEPLTARYARHGQTAIIEMAQTAGLPLVEDRRNPALTTTYGTGELILHAIQAGCTEIVIGLGGSCTNDAGTGAAAALGVRFLDQAGNAFVPTGGTLSRIHAIDASAARTLLENCRVTAMCDIDNPMFGPEGAAYVFGPQKGADPDQVIELDHNLQHLATIIERDLGLDVRDLPGAGAAGAMGAGIVAFLGGELKSGIQSVLDLVEFEKQLEGADLVITGEGKIDGQSLRGKVVAGIAERAKKQAVPVLVIVGAIGDEAEKAYDLGVSAIFSINRAAMPFEESRHHSKENLALTIDSLMRFQRLFDR
ncbi:MAG: glycerate kinase [Clostridia bacterium]|nr:glycerate kinase [Clostridia bacterium]